MSLRGKHRPKRKANALSYVPTFELLEERVVLDDNSAGVNGIVARGLTTPAMVALTGAGVVIGQVEPGRPGQSGAPLRDNAANSNPDVAPIQVFLRNGAPTRNVDTRPHATQVAGVMIANNAGPNSNQGVARNARLFASAYRTEGGAPTYNQALLSMQQIATQDGMRAVNLSFVKAGTLNGNSLLSLGLDWSGGP